MRLRIGRLLHFECPCPGSLLFWYNLQEAGSELLLFCMCRTDSQSWQALLYRLPWAGNTSWLALFVTYIIIWEDGGVKKDILGLQAAWTHLTAVFFFAMVKYFPVVFSSSVIIAIVAGFVWCLFAVINHVM